MNGTMRRRRCHLVKLKEWVAPMANKNDLEDLMPKGAVPIGLGCSRMGSVNGADANETRGLLRHALDLGIRFYDTSNIYAQGDSERLLGEVLQSRQDCIVCSKAGKYITWKRRTLMPLKGLLRGVVRRSKTTEGRIAAARAKPMPTCWEPAFLIKSLDDSLRRLRRERIELFMLHSPQSDVIRAGAAVDALERAKVAGKIGAVGVSVDDVETAHTCLEDPRVRVLQLPLLPGQFTYDKVLQDASEAGVAVIAREILGGTAAISRTLDPAAFAHDRIVEMIQAPQVALPLIGTTKMRTLDASIAAARAAMDTQ